MHYKGYMCSKNSANIKYTLHTTSYTLKRIPTLRLFHTGTVLGMRDDLQEGV